MARPDAKEIIRWYNEAKSLRSPLEQEWKMAAAYTLPAEYALWNTTGITAETGRSEASRRIAYDSTGMRSLPKYVSVLNRLATPINQKWHGLTASDENLRKNMNVRAYFEKITAMLFRQRYHSKARFIVSTSEMYSAMGVYGNGPLYIGERKKTVLNREPGLKYVSCSFRDTFFLCDDEGDIVTVFRRMWMNARQFKRKFKDKNIPDKIRVEADKPSPSETRYFEIVHVVHLRDEEDYDREAIDHRRHPIVGSYVCVESQEYIGDETGYSSLPYKIPRTATVSGSGYGYSPAVLALPSMGSASMIKKITLKQGNKAVDPVLLAYDDGVMNTEIDQRPGAVNYGGVSKEGRRLIDTLPTGNFNVAEKMHQDERSDIEDCFFVTLFQILNETPEMTATEVVERVAEKASLLAPTAGRLQSEFLGPTIERELDICAELGLLPPLPPELEEAKGEYDIVYTSPMAKSMYAEEVSGFARSYEMAANAATTKQDPAPLDIFNLDVALPEIADYLGTPARWMNDENKIADIRQSRQQQTQDAQLMQNAPALASAAKTASDMGKNNGG